MKFTATSYIIYSSLVLFLFIIIYLLTNPVFVKSEGNKPEIRVNKERLYSDVSKLTSISPPRNYQNISSLNKAADYILNQFKGMGCNAEIQEYQIGGKKYKNIICSFGPKDAKRIIVGAHYDVCGEQPGADDNASAVAGLLELARLLRYQKPELKSRVDLVAYTLEEPPYFKTDLMGSAVHAKSISESKIRVKVMIALEMIGYFTDSKNSQQYPMYLLKLLYPSKGNYIGVVGSLGQRKITRQIKTFIIQGSNIKVKSINAPTILPGIDFSDHLNYWKYGYQAVMITDTSFYRNPNYHRGTDTIDTLDFDRMAEVVKGVYWAIISL